MNAARGSAVALTGVALAAVLLSGCTPSTPAPDTSTSTSEATSPPTSPSPTTSGTPAEPSESSPAASEPTDAGSLPPGFPDPASLIGGDLTTTFSDTGSTTLVNGEDIGLVEVFGACFGGTGDHLCDWSIEGSAQSGPGGVPEPTDVSLLLLLRNAGTNADGTVTWSVVDAIATFAPGGQPALLQYCQGEDGVAAYLDPGRFAGPVIPAVAAWGPNADRTALVPLDPTEIRCGGLSD